MKTVILEVSSPSESMASFVQSRKSGNTSNVKRNTRIAFATPALLWQVLTATRWKLI